METNEKLLKILEATLGIKEADYENLEGLNNKNLRLFIDRSTTNLVGDFGGIMQLFKRSSEEFSAILFAHRNELENIGYVMSSHTDHMKKMTEVMEAHIQGMNRLANVLEEHTYTIRNSSFS